METAVVAAVVSVGRVAVAVADVLAVFDDDNVVAVFDDDNVVAVFDVDALVFVAIVIDTKQNENKDIVLDPNTY